MFAQIVTVVEKFADVGTVAAPPARHQRVKQHRIPLKDYERKGVANRPPEALAEAIKYCDVVGGRVGTEPRGIDGWWIRAGNARRPKRGAPRAGWNAGRAEREAAIETVAPSSDRESKRCADTCCTAFAFGGRATGEQPRVMNGAYNALSNVVSRTAANNFTAASPRCCKGRQDEVEVDQPRSGKRGGQGALAPSIMPKAVRTVAQVK